MQQQDAAASAMRGDVSLVSSEAGNPRDVFLRTSFVYAAVPPSELREASVDPVLRLFSNQPRVLFLGGHRELFVDHLLQANLIREMVLRQVSGRKVVVALDLIEERFQPVLDRFVREEMSEVELIEALGWRSSGLIAPQYDAYLPVVLMCRELGVPLIAVAPNNDTVTTLRKYGLAALSVDQRRKILPDPESLLETVTDPRFDMYISSLMSPRYSALGKQFNSLYPNDSILQSILDEGTSASIVQYAREHSNDAQIVVCSGLEKTKFGLGLPGRTSRLLKAGPRQVLNVLLNPTTMDSGRDLDSGGLRLELGTDIESQSLTNARMQSKLLLADYLWYSSNAPSSVRERANRWKKEAKRS